MKGPMTVPEEMEVCKIPIAYPDFSLGVPDETRARDEAIKPLIPPCTILKINNCSTFAENPINSCDIAKPNIALITIGFFPNLSPSIPHTGVSINDKINGPLKIIPLQCSSSSGFVMPSSRMKNGRKGTTILIPTIATNCAIHILYKFFFQTSNLKVLSIRFSVFQIFLFS